MRSSLFYNISARHEQKECDTSDTIVIQTTQVQHECNASETGTSRVQYECYTNDKSATQVLHKQHECNTTEKFLFW